MNILRQGNFLHFGRLVTCSVILFLSLITGCQFGPRVGKITYVHCFKLLQHPESLSSEGINFEDITGHSVINHDYRQVFFLGEQNDLTFDVTIPVDGRIRLSAGVGADAFRYGRDIKFAGSLTQGDKTFPLGEISINTRGKAKDSWHDAEWPMPDGLSGEGQLSFRADGLEPGAPKETAFIANPRVIEAPLYDPKQTIIWVGIDTLRADHLGCYGYDRDTSPNIDSFAKEAVVFENAIACSPWTFPSFASMFTGKFPSVAGAMTNVKFLPDSETTIAEILSGKDFATLSVVSSDWVGNMTNMQQGFDTVFAEKEDSAAKAFTYVLEWISTHQGERKFIFIHLMEPHLPYIPKPKNAGMFGPAGYNGEFKTSFDITPEEVARSGRTFTDTDKLRIEALYDEEIFGLDEDFGDFMGQLRESGIIDNAMMIICGDHGEEFWEHGGFEHGHQLYNELLHVPLMVKAKGFGSGERAGGICSPIDIFPTILEWLSMGIPDGLNAKPLQDIIKSAKSSENRVILSEQLYYGAEQKGVTDNKYRYIFHTIDNSEELYDYTDDPGMHQDIAQERRSAARGFRYLAKEVTLKSMSGWHLRFAAILATQGGRAYDLTITAPGGFSRFEGSGLDAGDSLTVEGETLKVHIGITGAAEKLVNFSTNDEPVDVSFDIMIDGEYGGAKMIHIGPAKEEFPFNKFPMKITDPHFGLGIPNFGEGEDPGLFIWGNSKTLQDELTPEIDDQVLQELQSIGYLR